MTKDLTPFPELPMLLYNKNYVYRGRTSVYTPK